MNKKTKLLCVRIAATIIIACSVIAASFNYITSLANSAIMIATFIVFAVLQDKLLKK